VSVVLRWDDRPETLERLLGVLRQLEAVGLLPLAGEVVGVEDLRPVERGRDGRQGATVPRVARRELDRLAREVPWGDLERRTSFALEHEQALLRSHQKPSHPSTPPVHWDAVQAVA